MRKVQLHFERQQQVDFQQHFERKRPVDREQQVEPLQQAEQRGCDEVDQVGAFVREQLDSVPEQECFRFLPNELAASVLDVLVFPVEPQHLHDFPWGAADPV